MARGFLHEPGDNVTLAGLDGVCRFKTDCSISFELGRREPGLFDVIGYVELHFPTTNPFCPVQMRLWLSSGNEDELAVDSLMRDLFAAFAIPQETKYELHIIFGGSSILHMNRNDVF
jgi:hypothetical protein